MVPKRALMPVALLVLLSACEPPSSSDGVDSSPLRGSIIESGRERPRFTLSDTDGKPYTFQDETEGLLSFIFFGYTNCPDVCPIHMATLASVIARLDPADRGRVRVSLIQVDKGGVMGAARVDRRKVDQLLQERRKAH